MKRITEKLGRVLLAGLLALSPILSVLIPLLIGVVAPVTVFFTQKPQEVRAVTRTLYWVGGTATWDGTAGTKWSLSTGGAGGEAVPDSDDDVFIDSFSSANTISTTGAVGICRNLDFTGGSGAFSGHMSTFGGNVYGSLTLSPTMTVDSGGQMTFKATTPGQTITSNGKLIRSAIFNGIGGEWTLQDAFYDSYGTTITNGSLITNNKTVSTLGMSMGAGGALTLGTSVISDISTWSITGGTLSAASSTINFSTASPILFAGNGQTYNIVSVTNIDDAFYISGANTFTTLTLTGKNATGDILTFQADQVITGTLTMTGYNATTKRLTVASNTLGTARQLTATVVSITNCNLRDLAGVGAASWDVSAGMNSDYGGNYGITFTTPQTNYWVGNSGSWSDSTHWSLTSGGAGGTGRVPIIQDTAVFDALSFTIAARTVTMDIPDVCTISSAYVTNTPTFSGTPVNIYGSLNLGLVTWTVTNAYMKKPTPSTITSVSSLTNLYIDTSSGVCTLTSDIIATGTVYLSSGTFDMDGYDVTAAAFDSSTTTYTRQILLGEGSMILNSAAAVTKFNVAATNLTISRESGTIRLTSSGANAQTFAGGDMTFGNVIIEGAGNYALSITGANTYADLTIDRSLAAKTVKFETLHTQTVTNFYIPISGATVVTLVGSTAPPTANVWTLTKTTGVVVTDYLSIEDSTANGGATFYSGSHSTHVSHVTGWSNTDPITPIVSTASASNILSNAVLLNGSLDTIDGVAIGYAYFQYGLTTSYGTTTALQTRTGAGTYSQAISGLSSATLYHYQAVFKYSGSTYVYGADVTFTTSAAPSGAPTIVTGVATGVTQTTATLQGSLTSLGIYTPVYVYFDWGTTSLCGTPTSEITETTTGGYSASIGNLTAGTTYYFRAVARYNTSNYVYGAVTTFAYSTLGVESTNVFRGYLETGDTLFCIEYVNNQVPYAPSKDPTIYFSMQLLSVDGTTILASTPLPHWGNSLTSIYLSSASSTTMTNGAAYIIRMIGTYASPPSATYTLTTNDWKGTNLVKLDGWARTTGWSINEYYKYTGTDSFIVSVAGREGDCISAVGEDAFVTGVPYLKSVRPLLFASGSLQTDNLFGGTPNLTFDSSKAWEVEVGSNIATDMTQWGNLFGLTGRNFNGFLILGIIMLLGGLLLSNGVVAVAGLFIAGLCLEVGTQFRAIDIQYLLVPTIILLVIFVMHFFWDRA